MRNTLRATTLESKLPLLAVEHGCIISKDADITVAFEVRLPELFTVTSAEYEAMHSAWCKAIKVLPHFSVVHKQDIFISENYRPELQREGLSFLDRSFERHFNERPYLDHRCCLFLTKTTKERMRQQSNFSTLCRGRITPKELNHEMAVKFMESVEQFERIINDTGCIRLRRLSDDEILGTETSSGIIEKYMSLSMSDVTCLEDIDLSAREMRVGDKMLCLHTLSDTDDLPAKVSTDNRYERLSTDRSDCRLSFASPVGLLLPCNHIYNQYVFIDCHDENLARFEKTARNMNSLSKYSRSNAINKEWIDRYLNEAHSYGLTSVRAHCNVMAWSDDAEELRRIKNDVGGQLATMGCMPRHNTIDCPTLFWAAMPGNEADFPAEESFYTFIEPAVCFFTGETNYRSSLSPFGIKMVDRLTGKPLHLDISDEPMKRGITTNRNKFILGPSGSGKSFFTNHLVRQYYEQGAHVLLIDTGNSYEGLCNLIHNRTHGEDGIYYTYTEESPISFNPFYTDDSVFDVEKKDSIKTLLLTLWKSEDDRITKTESGELGSALSMFIDRMKSDRDIVPCFNSFYEFMRDEYREEMAKRPIPIHRQDFDIDNFLTTLRQYYHGGRFDFLLNSKENIDLLNKRFVVFEIDNVKDNKELFPVVTIIIMEAFINKMRRLKGIRKVLICEEAWKALSTANMAEYMRYMYKTVRKYFGEAIVVTQEVEDIISSPIVKETIINNSDCKILLDQRKYMNRFDQIQSLLGLTDKVEALTYKYRTLFEQSEKLIKIAAQNFDSDGKVLAESGILTTAQMTGLYAIDSDGNLRAFVGAGQDGVKIKADNIQLEGIVTANGNFKILEDGSIETINGKFTGEINANKGTIGGFIIDESSIRSENGYTNPSTGEKITTSRFSLFSKGSPWLGFHDAYRGVRLGLDTMPLGSAVGAAQIYVSNSTPSELYENYGVYINVSGGRRNIGLWMFGDIHATARNYHVINGDTYFNGAKGLRIAMDMNADTGAFSHYYEGVTFGFNDYDLDKVRFQVQNGLIIGVKKE